MSDLKANLYDLMDSEHGRDLVRESIAEIFHEAWMKWSQDLNLLEDLSTERVDRWKIFWRTPYCQIPMDEKIPEMEYAERIMTRLGLNTTDAGESEQ